MEQLSLPEDFIKKMQTLLQDEWEDFAYSYQNHKYQALRLNPLKKGLARKDYPGVLERLGVTEQIPVPWAEDAFYYEEQMHPGKHPYHEMGMYYIQEPSAMSAASLLRPQPGERVLDLCAAPGGKTTQLAAYLAGGGLLVANEIHPQRCKVLSQNVERMGISNAIVTNEESGKLALRFSAYFHKILVDAPCSGEGMFRKNPEAMDEWSPEQVQICADRQRSILEDAAGMLMPGGVLVYSTCTFSPEENEGVISSFLSRHEEFELVKVDAPYFDPGKPHWADAGEELERTFRLFPHHLHGEGHFVAVMHKKGVALKTSGSDMPEHALNGRKRKQLFTNQPDKAMLQIFADFAECTLTQEMQTFLPEGELTMFGQQLYRLPTDSPDLSGLRVLRAGLHIGTFKKNRFEPSHALALFLGNDDVQNCVELKVTDKETADYFRGETLNGACSSGKNGYCLVCVDGYSAGWGKRTGDQIKNHYPKGLRKEHIGE